MPILTRHRNHQRIIAHCRRRRSPGRQIRQRIRPAEGKQPLLGSLPSVSPAAHPVIRVSQRDSTDPMLLRKSNRPLHASQRIQISNTSMSIPPLQPTEPRNLRGLRCDIDRAVRHLRRKPRKPVQPMRIDAITRRLSKELRNTRRALPPPFQAAVTSPSRSAA